MPGPVLHVAQPTDAGVGAYVAAAAADQVARGWSVVVACPPEGRLPAAAREAGATVLDWPAGREPGPGIAAETRRLHALIGRTDPAVVHLHSSKAGLAGRLALRGRRPTLFQPHGWSWYAASGPARVAARRWEISSARWATRLVSVSDGERDAGLAAGVRGRHVVIRNGVDLTRFASLRSTAAQRAARDRLGLGSDVGIGPVVVCVGRLCRQKGQDRLLAAWPQVRAEHAGATLLLVGDGPDLSATRAAAGAGVRIVTDCTDVRDHLAAADAVVLPSRWEGLSLAMLEALAAGRPVVTTRVAGSEVLPADAGTVLGADPDDDAAVVAGLATALGSYADPGRAAAAGAAAAAYADAELDERRTFTALAELTASLAD